MENNEGSRSRRGRARIALLLGVVAAGLAGVAACGGGDGGGSDSAKASTSASAHATDSPSPSATASAGTGAATPPVPKATAPMATAPASLRLHLVHKGRLTICALPATGYIQDAQNNKSQGLDVEMLSLVAERLRVAPSVIDTDFQRLEAELRAKTCDVVASAFTDVEPLKAYLVGSTPYFRSASVVISDPGRTYDSIDALAGKRVGAISGSIEAEQLKKLNATQHTNIQVNDRVSDTTALTFMIRERQVDGAFVGNAAGMRLAHQAGLALGKEIGRPQPVVFGVARGEPELRTQIDAALHDAAKNGRYAQAYQAWFGRPPSWQPS